MENIGNILFGVVIIVFAAMFIFNKKQNKNSHN